MKWCRGICGRELALSAFLLNRHGNPDRMCRVCRRYLQRRHRRVIYRTRAQHRERVKSSRRSWYAAHAEQERAARRDRWQRRKLECHA